jgi:hypothetical protein
MHVWLGRLEERDNVTQEWKCYRVTNFTYCAHEQINCYYDGGIKKKETRATYRMEEEDQKFLLQLFFFLNVKERSQIF